jgi:mRNA interferase HicA
MKRRDLLAHLSAHGCALLREGARHSWWHNQALNKRSAVPRHTEVDISHGRSVVTLVSLNRNGSDLSPHP